MGIRDVLTQRIIWPRADIRNGPISWTLPSGRIPDWRFKEVPAVTTTKSWTRTELGFDY